MSVELRSLWVFSQVLNDSGMVLVTSRRFQSVEIRYKRAQEQLNQPYKPIPSDQVVLDELSKHFLHEHRDKGEKMPSISKELTDMAHNSPFNWSEREEGLLEKSWPLGPISSICDGAIWPLVFISTSGDYSSTPRSDRFIVAAVVSVPGPRRLLIDMPQITAAFGVLEEVSSYLPSSPSLASNPAASARFQFFLKSALPFGSPVITSPEVLEQMNNASVTRADQAYMQNLANQSSRRLPSWRPLPTHSVESVTVSQNPPLSRSVTIKVSERLICQLPPLSESTSPSSCTIVGAVEFDSDILGTPEIVVPLNHSCRSPVITLHESARISEVLQDPPNTVEKISFIPPTMRFVVAKYFYTDDTNFPVRADFSLMQISQSTFRFRLALDHKILFQYLFIRFRVFKDLETGGRVQSFPSIDCSPRSKIEVLDSGEVQWSLKNPSTFTAEGEFVEGVAEITGLSQSSDLSRNAVCHFALLGDESFGSNFSINPKLVTVFPHVSKSLNVSYSVQSQSCLIPNTALGEDDSIITPETLEDCIVCEKPAEVIVNV
jgi:hypothetical protein